MITTRHKICLNQLLTGTPWQTHSISHLLHLKNGDNTAALLASQNSRQERADCQNTQKLRKMEQTLYVQKMHYQYPQP